MSETVRLRLPLIAAAQAQKHVTHNEALARLDTLAHLHLLTRAGTPPGSPLIGDCHLVTTPASGAFAGKEDHVAEWTGADWVFHPPVTGLVAYLASAGTLVVRTAAGWRDYGGLLSPSAVLSRSAGGATTALATLEATLSGLSGSFIEATGLIPNRAVVFGVSTRTLTSITGAASYDCGLAAERSKFGGTLGSAAGSGNAGVIGPTAFYAATAVRLSANGGSFTGGSVRIAVHCLLPGVPDA